MRSYVEQVSSERFRPFFRVDQDFRIRDWPETSAGVFRIPAENAVGRRCWEVVFGGRHAASGARCARCPLPQLEESALLADTPPGTAPRPHCAILPLAGPARGALVWPPFSHIATGPLGSALLEGLVIRGALAERLGSVEDTLDGIRRVCAADDCELFLVDPSGKEVFLAGCAGYDREAFMERTHMPLGAGYPGTVTLQQKPLFTNQFQKDRVFLRDGVRRRGIRSFIGVPLTGAGGPLGYVGVGWKDESVPMDWVLRILEDIKSLVPLAIPRELLPVRKAPAAPARLTIRCFGPFEVFRDGQKIPHAAFARRKALQLLKSLILKRGAPVHRDKLIEHLWPDAAPRLGANRLHGVLNALRSAIESGRRQRESQYIVCRDDHYFFNVEAPQFVDLFAFSDLLGAARAALRQGAEARALGLLDDAVRLYRGDLYADDAEDESLESHRVRLRHAYLDAVRSLAKLRVRLGHGDEAIAVMRAALDIEPAALDLHETLIVQLARAGRIVEARQQYECCRAALRRYLDMEPPPRTHLLEKLLD